MKAEIGFAIKKDRLALGLSQTEFSELVGTSKNSISYWERGICSPYIENIMQIIKVLGHDSHIAECVREIFKKPSAVQYDKQPVVRWLWANINGSLSTTFASIDEVNERGCPEQWIRLEWSRQEFSE
jgi:transcriptional regulator with XRE-family HTH domain